MKSLLALGYTATKALLISCTLFCVVLFLLMLWGSRKIGKKQRAEHPVEKKTKVVKKQKVKKTKTKKQPEPTRSDEMLQDLIKEHEQKMKESKKAEKLVQKEVQIKEVDAETEENNEQ